MCSNRNNTLTLYMETIVQDHVMAYLAAINSRLIERN